jgi:uncharacterized membrane protein YphA (DoxX/SURF4 family)
MQSFAEGNKRLAAPVVVKPAMNIGLWTVQVTLAALFLFSGVMKFMMPVARMQEGPVKLPGLFLHFIGVAEMLGGLGLILPGMLRVRRGLTPLAAAGLLIIMIGATVVTLMGGGGATALLPLAVAILVAFVVYGRWSWFAA